MSLTGYSTDAIATSITASNGLIGNLIVTGQLTAAEFTASLNIDVSGSIDINEPGDIGELSLGWSAGDAVVNVLTDDALSLKTNNIEALRINNTGGLTGTQNALFENSVHIATQLQITNSPNGHGWGIFPTDPGALIIPIQVQVSASELGYNRFENYGPGGNSISIMGENGTDAFLEFQIGSAYPPVADWVVGASKKDCILTGIVCGTRHIG